MSGMGGLNIRAKKQQSMRRMRTSMGNTLSIRNCMYKMPAASIGGKPMRHSLLFGKTLTALSTKGAPKGAHWPRVKNLGKVKMIKIGQPACSPPKGATLAYGGASETEREWVRNASLSNSSELKIQSIPLRKRRGKECLQQLNPYCYKLHLKNNIKINHF